MKKLLMVVAVATALVGVTPVYAEESATQSSAVFEKFDGMEQMASLTEQDKALTGAAWMSYKAYYWDFKAGFLGSPNTEKSPTQYLYVRDCNPSTQLRALVMNPGKSFSGGVCIK